MWTCATACLLKCRCVRMRACEGVRLWKCVRACWDVGMLGCEDVVVRLWGREGVKVWWFETVRLQGCEDMSAWVWGCENMRMSDCEAKMWLCGCKDVSVWGRHKIRKMKMWTCKECEHVRIWQMEECDNVEMLEMRIRNLNLIEFIMFFV